VREGKNSGDDGLVAEVLTLADCTEHRTQTAAVRNKTKNEWRRCARLNRTENARRHDLENSIGKTGGAVEKHSRGGAKP
jgi:hypothetical protein